MKRIVALALAGAFLLFTGCDLPGGPVQDFRGSQLPSGQIYAAAAHEAGHTAACLANGGRARGASINVNGGGISSCVISDGTQSAIVDLAGAAAESVLLHDHGKHDSSAPDFDKARNTVGEDYMSLMPTAERVVSQHATAIRAIAGELAQNGSISGSRAEELYAAAEGGGTSAMYQPQRSTESTTAPAPAQAYIGQPTADHSVELPRGGPRRPGGGGDGGSRDYDPGEKQPEFTKIPGLPGIIEAAHQAERARFNTPEARAEFQRYLKRRRQIGALAAWREVNALLGGDSNDQ